MSEATELPAFARFMERHPGLQRIPARVLGLGLLQEHAPKWARRPAGKPAPAAV